MEENSAVGAAIRLKDIPFVEFTTDLVTQVFDSLVQSHILQMQEYANFVNTLSEGLSEYINNTIDNVSFQDVSSFISSYSLPVPPNFDIEKALAALKSPTSSKIDITNSNPNDNSPADNKQWWGGLINALGPVVSKLVDKIKDPDLVSNLGAIDKFNDDVKDISLAVQANMPTYKEIHSSIAALIASNKYALLQNMVNQGMMQLRVSRGKIETRLSFNTFTYANSSQYSSTNVNDKQKVANNKFSGGGLIGLLSGKKGFQRDVSKVITVSHDSSSSNSSSGTNISIFGGLTLEFETK